MRHIIRYIYNGHEDGEDHIDTTEEMQAMRNLRLREGWQPGWSGMEDGVMVHVLTMEGRQ